MTAHDQLASRKRQQAQAVATAFLALFSIVGFAFYGLPFFYDFFVARSGLDAGAGHLRQRLQQARVGPLFGFFAGVVVDRFGPRRLMLVGILLAGLARSASATSPRRSSLFYTFY